MKSIQLSVLLASVSVLAACTGGNGGNTDLPDTIGEALEQGDGVLAGRASTSSAAFDGAIQRDTPREGSVQVQRVSGGYALSFAGETVTFTDDELVDDNYYEKWEQNSTGDDRLIGLFYAVGANLREELMSGSAPMLPIAFIVRTNSEGIATANDADGEEIGFAVLGTPTQASEMPTTGQATYSGEGRLAAHRDTVDFDGPDGAVTDIEYSGETEFTADFGSGQVDGSMTLDDKRTYYVGQSRLDEDISRSEGARFVFAPAAIDGSGFTSDVSPNQAAVDIMRDEDGVDVNGDTSFTGRGDFYGENAEGVGMIISGDTDGHVFTGVAAGTKE